MKKLILLCMMCLFLIGLSSSVNAVTYITTCGTTITTPGQYVLGAITNCPGNGVNIAVDGVDLSCWNPTVPITGSGLTGIGIGINVGTNNNHIHDCSVSNFDQGIRIMLGSGNYVEKVISNNNNIGIRVTSTTATGNSIAGSNFQFNTNEGILLDQQSSGTMITDIPATSSSAAVPLLIDHNGGDGIKIDNSGGNFIDSGNTQQIKITQNSGNGIYLTGVSPSNTIQKTLVKLNLRYGLQIDSQAVNQIVKSNTFNSDSLGDIIVYSDGNIFDGNNLVVGGAFGFKFDSADYNGMYGNLVVGSISNSTGILDDGIVLVNSNYNGIASNSIYSFADIGIFLTNSDYNDIKDNRVSFNKGGIYLSSSHNNQIIGVISNLSIYSQTVNFNSLDGINLVSSNNNVISTTLVESNTGYGLKITSSIGNTVQNNLIQNNGLDGVNIDPSIVAIFTGNSVIGHIAPYYDIYVETDSSVTYADGDTCDRSYNFNDDGSTGCDYTTIVVDADGDGYDSDIDCDDNNAAVNPGATEVCDEVDNNCDAIIDDVDFDNDLVNDCSDDKCLSTVDWFAQNLQINHYDSSNQDLMSSYGCACDQILFCKPGNNHGEFKNGCTVGTMNVWSSQIGWALDCQVDGVVVNAGEDKDATEDTDNDGVVDIVDNDDDNDGVLDCDDSEEDSVTNSGKPDWWCKKHPSKC